MCLGELRLVTGHHGLGLRHAGLEVGRVEVNQDVALLDGLSFGESNRQYLAVHARLDGDALVGLGPPDDIQEYRHLAALRPGDDHGYRWGGLGRGGRGRFLDGPPPGSAAEQGGDDEGGERFLELGHDRSSGAVGACRVASGTGHR